MIKQYFSSAELDFSGTPETLFVLEMHHISEETAKQLEGYTVLEFEENILNNAYFKLNEKLVLGSDNEQVENSVNQNLAGYVELNKLSPLKSKVNTKWFLNINQYGKSQLGGKPPEGFVFPLANFASGFQYIGKISKEEDAFTDLDFDLHLIYPVCLDYHPPLFLDISKPLKPLLLPLDTAQTLALCWPKAGETYLPEARYSGPDGNIIEGSDFQDVFEENNHLEFERIFISFNQTAKNIVWGHAGFPEWVQYPEIPYCPKTQKPMKFLCAIGFNITRCMGPKAVPSKLRLPETSPYSDTIKYMQFWRDGDLFVFYSPEGKTLCLFPQNT